MKVSNTMIVMWILNILHEFVLTILVFGPVLNFSTCSKVYVKHYRSESEDRRLMPPPPLPKRSKPDEQDKTSGPSDNKNEPKPSSTDDKQYEEFTPWQKRQNDIKEAKLDLENIEGDLATAEKALSPLNKKNLPEGVKVKSSELDYTKETYSGYFKDNPEKTKEEMEHLIDSLGEQKKGLKEEIKDLEKTPNEAVDDLPSDYVGPDIYEGE